MLHSRSGSKTGNSYSIWCRTRGIFVCLGFFFSSSEPATERNQYLLVRVAQPSSDSNSPFFVCFRIFHIKYKCFLLQILSLLVVIIWGLLWTFIWQICLLCYYLQSSKFLKTIVNMPFSSPKREFYSNPKVVWNESPWAPHFCCSPLLALFTIDAILFCFWLISF